MADIGIHINVEGVGEAISWLDRVQRKCEPPEILEPLGHGADVYVRGAQRRAPVRTGRLMTSIDKELEGTDTYEIGPSDDLIPIYAAPQEFGAKGHPYMKFQIDGQWVQVRAIKPHPYMDPTYRQDTREAFNTFKESFFRSIDRA